MTGFVPASVRRISSRRNGVLKYMRALADDARVRRRERRIVLPGKLLFSLSVC
jgi:hypothetical protein